MTAIAADEDKRTKAPQACSLQKIGHVSDRFLRMNEVCEITGLRPSTIFKYRKTGHFVRPVAIGGKAVRYLESEVRAWMKARVDARNLGEKMPPP